LAALLVLRCAVLCCAVLGSFFFGQPDFTQKPYSSSAKIGLHPSKSAAALRMLAQRASSTGKLSALAAQQQATSSPPSPDPATPY
jgi:hypothetical protein